MVRRSVSEISRKKLTSGRYEIKWLITSREWLEFFVNVFTIGAAVFTKEFYGITQYERSD